MRVRSLLRMRALRLCLCTAVTSAAFCRENVDTPFSELGALPLPQLKARLQTAGWPATHVHAFLEAEIVRRYSADALSPDDLLPFEFWRTGPDAQPIRPDVQRRREEKRQRAEAVMQAEREKLNLFDPLDGDHAALFAWEDQRRWGALPANKRAAVTATLERGARELSQFLHQRGGMLTRSEWERAWQITEHTRAHLATLLTAGQLLDYDLRNSETAARMRAELDNFQPSREEFLAIFRLRHPLELAFAHKRPSQLPDVLAQLASAEAEVEKQIAALLGPERYDDYRLSLQPACQTLQFDGRYAQADAAVIRALYRSLLITRQRLTDAAALPASEREAAIRSLKDALYREFRTVLDDEATRRYLQEQGLWP